MPSETPPLDPEEFARILEKLDPVLSTGAAIIVGGQALVAYSAAFGLDGGPDTTRDLDLLGDRSVARRCAELLGGRARLATIDDHTPHVGLVLFTDSHGYPRQLDVLHDLFGVTGEHVRESAIEIGHVLVVHPLLALKDKVAQLGVLRVDAIVVAQTRLAARATRALSRLILDDESVAPPLRRREALRLNTRVYELAMSRAGVRVYADFAVDVLDALIDDHPLLPAKTLEIDIPTRRARVTAKRLAYARHVAD